MEYKIVEAWGAMSYVDPDTHETLYEETEDMCQCYWVVAYNPEEKEIESWEEVYPSYEAAERALLGLTESEVVEP